MKRYVFQITALEGEEIYYQNPFDRKVIIGSTLDDVKGYPPKVGLILGKGETTLIKASTIFVRVL